MAKPFALGNIFERALSPKSTLNGLSAMKLVRFLLGMALTMGLACHAGATQASDSEAQYQLEPGDVLSLNVVGVPELTTKLPIGIDGGASFPLIGQVEIAGRTLAQARATVQQLMEGKSIHRTTADGSVFTVAFAPADIGLSIEEYRPVYINGDVAKPGEQMFRPGLTVRRAVALAGGYDILRFKLDNPFLQVSDLTGEYESLWIAYTRQQAAIARMKAELDNKTSLDSGSLVASPISKSLGNAIVDNERKQLEMNNLDFQKETAYLKEATTHEAERSKVLSQQQAKETEGAASDTAELERYQDLYKRGAVTLPSVADARRTALLSSTRELQTTALLASVQREEEDLNRRLDRLGDTRRIELLRSLQEMTSESAVTTSKLQAVSEKLRYTGMVKSQLTRGIDSDPTVFILHDGAKSPEKIAANLDTPLRPGDTVEIALQTALAPGER
jgi:polysaccharide export outer membrane protein